MKISKKLIFIIVVLTIVFIPNVWAADESGAVFGSLCGEISEALRVLGYLIVVAKIAVPLIIIIIGCIKFINAIVSKPGVDTLKDDAKKMLWSLISGILVFFIPPIVYTAMSFIDNFQTNQTADSQVCKECILKPFSDTCTNAVETNKNK